VVGRCCGPHHSALAPRYIPVGGGYSHDCKRPQAGGTYACPLAPSGLTGAFTGTGSCRCTNCYPARWDSRHEVPLRMNCILAGALAPSNSQRSGTFHQNARGPPAWPEPAGQLLCQDGMMARPEHSPAALRGRSACMRRDLPRSYLLEAPHRLTSDPCSPLWSPQGEQRDPFSLLPLYFFLFLAPLLAIAAETRYATRVSRSSFSQRV
jgi:hypothetical protein